MKRRPGNTATRCSVPVRVIGRLLVECLRFVPYGLRSGQRNPASGSPPSCTVPPAGEAIEPIFPPQTRERPPSLATRTALALPFALLSSLACTLPESATDTVHVFVASSLQDAVEEVLALEVASATTVYVNSGSSGILRRQIEHSGRADLFFTADPSELEPLLDEGLLHPESVRVLLANQLVVVRAHDADRPARQPVAAQVTEVGSEPAPSNLDPAQLFEDAGRIAIGQPDVVPAGRYARTWLERIGLWQLVSQRILPTANVRAVIAAVRAGGADLGIVYATDAQRFPEVDVVYRVPTRGPEAPAIRYALALVADNAPESDSESPETNLSPVTRQVYALLCGEAAVEIYLRHGFLLAPEFEGREVSSLCTTSSAAAVPS